MMRGNDRMKKILMVITAAVLLTALVYQGSMAFFHSETQVGAKISAGNLGIDLVENTESTNATKTDKGFQITAAMPGDEIKNAVYVKNVKDNTLYVRVTATKFWEDENGNKLPDADASLIKFKTNDLQDWIIIDDAENSNSEVVYFYYKKPIKSDTSSSNLIDSVIIDPRLEDKQYTNYRINLSFDAEAVQSYQGKDAILSEWGAEIVTDANGNIVSVED